MSFAFALTGCCTISSKEAFFNQNPGLRNKYVRFEEASPYIIETFNYRSNHAELAILEGLRNHFHRDSEDTNYVSQIGWRVEALYKDDTDFHKQLKKNFASMTDQLFYYDYRDGDDQEQGGLILRHNKIFKKYVLASSFKQPGDKP
ncbi:MAG: hypothetical protein ABSB84_15625 [Verrucomicrobiota bacterium]